jgi:hypothetical protein
VKHIETTLPRLAVAKATDAAVLGKTVFPVAVPYVAVLNVVPDTQSLYKVAGVENALDISPT